MKKNSKNTVDMISISVLIDKYAENPYMKQRLQHHLNSLPLILETEETNREKRQLRNFQLCNDQVGFIEDYLNNYSYFYLSSNNTFYTYNGLTYDTVSENDLNYHILTSITENGNITPWKYKTKHAILKRIKERPLLRSIPESNTIQYILNQFYPMVFDSKEETKYFLTILGDALLKKYSEEDPVIFLVTGKTKKFLTDIDTHVYNITNISNLTSSIVTKYHDTYDLNNCRLIQIRSCNLSSQVLKENCIDFLCVCAYYSERFVNSETYLLSQCDDSLKSKVLYLKGKNKEEIFQDFLSKCFEIGRVECNVSWKNIHYLWKQYTMQTFLPTNVIYSNILKTFFASKFEQSEEGFMNLTSKLLPEISNFLTFMDQNIVVDDTSELEIDEIISLYRHASGVSISEASVLNILNHYFPHLEISDNKYVVYVSCSFWKKREDIIYSLTLYKSKNECIVVSLDTLYAFYIKQKFALKMHSSKRFFKKYIETTFSDNIELEQCLNLINIDLKPS